MPYIGSGSTITSEEEKDELRGLIGQTIIVKNIFDSNKNSFYNNQNYDYPEYICSEKQRVKDIKYQYLVHLECDKKHISHVVDKETWDSLSIGLEVIGSKDKYGQIKVDWDNYLE